MVDAMNRQIVTIQSVTSVDRQIIVSVERVLVVTERIQARTHEHRVYKCCCNDLSRCLRCSREKFVGLFMLRKIHGKVRVSRNKFLALKSLKSVIRSMYCTVEHMRRSIFCA